MTTIQITFDCSDPHRMARFWADALGYEKENHTTLVHELVTSGRLSPDQTLKVDDGVQFADVSACRDPAGVSPRLFFQRVPEDKQAKNRVHLDLHVGRDRVEPEAVRLERLGARRLWFSDDRGGDCWTLADVEGNEFCVD